MGKIKSFFQKTGVAIAVLAMTVIGAIKLSPALTDPGVLSQALTVAGGLVGAGAVMIGCGIGKAVQSSKEKKLLKQYNEPELEKPKQTANDFVNGAKNTAGSFANGFNNGYNKQNDFGQKMGHAAERIGEKVGEGANKLGVKLNEIFNNQNRPNTSANPYSSTVNTGSNPYSSRDRMSAGYGGTYNGKQYGNSYTGDVRDARQMGNTGGYYSGQNQNYNNNSGNRYNNGNNGRNGQNGKNGYNGNNRQNQGSYNYNNQYQNQNVQYGGQNNRPSNNNYNNQNVQYGSYQNGRSQNGNSTYGAQNTNIPNTSGLEESAKTNYFDNEPGSSSYRSGPLKKEKI
ncbi:MAG: hypothetical protein IKW90_02715 [Lachnospiraceae bacterium]|nr:hypothetical protein [Lachnospiraceae bacterium]